MTLLRYPKATEKKQEDFLTHSDALDSDTAAIHTWFETMHKHVADVNFTAATPLFDEDAVGFGTFEDVIDTREAIIAQQWRSVWGTIANFAFKLDQLKLDVSSDRCFAYGVVPWGSTGFHEDQTPYDRPGRATIIFRRPDPSAPWRAIHSHFSLNRNVPSRSYGDRPEMV